MKFKKGDRVKLKIGVISKDEWKPQFGDLPMNTVFTVSHINKTGNCLHLVLPDNWEKMGCRDVNTPNTSAHDPNKKAFSFGFYSYNFTLVQELPEDLFEL